MRPKFAVGDKVKDCDHTAIGTVILVTKRYVIAEFCETDEEEHGFTIYSNEEYNSIAVYNSKSITVLTPLEKEML